MAMPYSLLEIAVMCWILWLNRNDAVFQRLVANSLLQVIFRGTFWIRQWFLLCKEEERGALKEVAGIRKARHCNFLEFMCGRTSEG